MARARAQPSADEPAGIAGGASPSCGPQLSGGYDNFKPAAGLAIVLAVIVDAYRQRLLLKRPGSKRQSMMPSCFTPFSVMLQGLPGETVP